MNFVRPIYDMKSTSMRPHRGQREVVAQSGSPKNLYGPIHHVRLHLGSYDFNHSDLVLSRLLAQRVNHPGRFERQQARLLDLQVRLRDPFLNGTLLDQGLSESDARGGTLTHQLQSVVSNAYCAHAVMNAPGSQTSLGDGKTAALLAQQ